MALYDTHLLSDISDICFENVSVYNDRMVCIFEIPGRVYFRMIGKLCSRVTEPGIELPTGYENPADSLSKLLTFHLNTKSAVQRIVIAEVVSAWAVCQVSGLSIILGLGLINLV